MNGKILVVDDDPATVKWLRTVLEHSAYEVQTAERGEQALALFRSDSPQLIILDLTLPDLDGLEICRRIRHEPHGNNVWILILSARTSSDAIVDALKAGADDYVVKRIGADVELLARVRGVIGRTRQGVPTRRGRIISFFSPKGGSGTTTLAVNTAYGLQHVEPNATVLLVDLVFPLGTVAFMLGFQSSHTLARLSRTLQGREPQADDVARFIEPAALHHFDVLLSANDLQEAQTLEVSQIVPIFKQLGVMYDYIVVDFGRSLSRITLPVLEISDLILTIVSPDVMAVALTRASLNYMAAANISQTRIALIQNRTVPRSWMARETLEQELGRPVWFTIPHDGEQMTLVLNAHKIYLEQYDNTVSGVVLSDMVRGIIQRLHDTTPAVTAALM